MHVDGLSVNHKGPKISTIQKPGTHLLLQLQKQRHEHEQRENVVGSAAASR